MEIKLFWLKVKRFFKRNAYSMAVGACSAIALVSVAMIAILVAMPTSTPETELPVETVTPTAIVFTSPIKDADISKEFAHDKLLEDKTSGYWQTHSGIDISADEGTSVLAVFDGVVESVEKSMMEGTIITINHANSLKTIYKCLSDENIMVKKGDKVKKSDKIGVVGMSLKEKADGAHLHFEVVENGKHIDPTIYLEDNESK